MHLIYSMFTDLNSLIALYVNLCVDNVNELALSQKQYTSLPLMADSNKSAIWYKHYYYRLYSARSVTPHLQTCVT